MKWHATAHLPRGHYPREFLNELDLSFTVIFVPPTKPKSVAGKVFEYVERRGNRDGTFRHGAVCHQMRVAAQEACHSCRRLATNTIQTEENILSACGIST